jgi:hypothetical protein
VKIAVLGCGLRTPLLLSGLARSERLSADVTLFDIDGERGSLIGSLGRAAEPTRYADCGGTAEAVDGAIL